MPHNPNRSRSAGLGFIGITYRGQCGIATFTTDLCEAIAAEQSDTTCIAVR